MTLEEANDELSKYFLQHWMQQYPTVPVVMDNSTSTSAIVNGYVEVLFDPIDQTPDSIGTRKFENDAVMSVIVRVLKNTGTRQSNNMVSFIQRIMTGRRIVPKLRTKSAPAQRVGVPEHSKYYVQVVQVEYEFIDQL